MKSCTGPAEGGWVLVPLYSPGPPLCSATWWLPSEEKFKIYPGRASWSSLLPVGHTDSSAGCCVLRPQGKERATVWDSQASPEASASGCSRAVSFAINLWSLHTKASSELWGPFGESPALAVLWFPWTHSWSFGEAGDPETCVWVALAPTTSDSDPGQCQDWSAAHLGGCTRSMRVHVCAPERVTGKAETWGLMKRGRMCS